MKKIVFLALIIAIFTISGCTAKNSSDKSANNSLSREDFASRRPDFGQPERAPDIRGLVSSMVGNEVSVLKIDSSNRSARSEQVDEQDKNEDSEERKTTLGTGITGGRMPGMGRGGTRPDGGEADAEMQAQMLERMKEMSTGEETILIPVGIQMLKPGDNTEKMEMVEATLEDINENKMIQVWLNESVTDRKVAEFVLIMQ